MRTLFSVAAKLLGVFIAYLGLIHLVNAFLLGEGQLAPVLVQVLAAALALGFGAALVFRTDSLARFVGVSSDESAVVEGLDSRDLLRTGIILVGLYVFLTRVGMVLGVASSHIGGVQFIGIGGALARILIECVPLALAALFIFRADRVVDVVGRERLLVH
jgi:hypothetical protein